MICYTNAGGGGSSSSAWAYISVSYPSGSTCTATNGTDTLTAADTSGAYVFEIEEPSSTPETWTVSCTDGTHTKTATADISTQYQCAVLTLSYYSRLPEGYQEVEYLQSSGTQCIDTGLSRLDYNEQLEIDFMKLDSQTQTVFAYRYNDLNFFGLYQGGGYRWEGSVVASSSVQVNVKAVTVMNNSDHAIVENNVTVTSSALTNPSSETPQYATIALFASHNSSNNNYYNFASARIYKYVRTDLTDDTVVQNLVPCYRISDSVAGMYDLVSDTFLTNVGTGTFTVGADV